jgi:aspartate-semialdehyde dehydrogenase
MNESRPRLRVGILGATGAVGQTFIRLLAEHPLFEIAALAASERSAGQKYVDAASWFSARPMPEGIAETTVIACEPEAAADLGCDLVFSGLDADAADTIEPAFASAGIPVISNAKSFRMHENVPLLIPEVNPDHTALIDRQDWGNGGFIVTNPNCSAVGLVMALKPLHDAFGIEAVHVVTMQALSGAGYPGVSSLDILGNVIPHIGGEEEKLAEEPRKILGVLEDGKIRGADFAISAQCNRVPVIDGHLECASVRFSRDVTPEEAREVLEHWQSPLDDMSIDGEALPSAPERPIHHFDDPRYPQPRRHAGLGNGMQVSVGKIQACPVLGVKFVVLSHNTVRGAAGGAILNAELLLAQGRLATRATA